jgi:hypothetical protein
MLNTECAEQKPALSPAAKSLLAHGETEPYYIYTHTQGEHSEYFLTGGFPSAHSGAEHVK